MTKRYVLVQHKTFIDLVVEERENVKLQVGEKFPCHPTVRQTWYIIKVFDDVEQGRLGRVEGSIGEAAMRNLFKTKVLEAAMA